MTDIYKQYLIRKKQWIWRNKVCSPSKLITSPVMMYEHRTGKSFYSTLTVVEKAYDEYKKKVEENLRLEES